MIIVRHQVHNIAGSKRTRLVLVVTVMVDFVDLAFGGKADFMIDLLLGLPLVVQNFLDDRMTEREFGKAIVNNRPRVRPAC